MAAIFSDGEDFLTANDCRLPLGTSTWVDHTPYQFTLDASNTDATPWPFSDEEDVKQQKRERSRCKRNQKHYWNR